MFINYLSKGLIAVLALVLTACASQPEKPTVKVKQVPNVNINASLFHPQNFPAPVTSEQIFELSSDQQAYFLAYFNKEVDRGILPHHAIFNFLDARMSGFTYYGETYTAEQAMRLKKGNCLSLAILTTALAKIVNVEYQYREVSTIPIFNKEGSIITSSSHLQVLLMDPTFVEDEEFIHLVKPSIVVDYFPSKKNERGRLLGETDLISSFYRNLAAEKLSEDQLEHAMVYAKKAYDTYPYDAKNLSLMAVIHRRGGDEETALEIYEEAVNLSYESVGLLSNYRLLLLQLGDEAQAEFIDDRLSQNPDPNPYVWLEQAYVAHAEGDYARAFRMYYKVIDRAPYVVEAYQGLYKIYRRNGEVHKAKLVLKTALEWSYEIEDRKLFKQKLMTLAKR